MKYTLKIILLGLSISIFSAAENLQTETGRVYALCYHSFIGGRSYTTDFSTEEVSNQMQSLADLGYTFITLEDMLSNRISGNLNILFTIDDGNFSIYDNAYEEVFIPFDIKPVLFIYPAIIDTMSYAMTGDEVDELIDFGASVGGHGYNHLFINEELYTSDYDAFWREIYKCKSSIESKTKVTDCTVFAFPYGVYSDVTLENLQTAGFDYAFTIEEGYISLPVDDFHSPYLLPRYMITTDNWDEVYEVLKTAAELENQT